MKSMLPGVIITILLFVNNAFGQQQTYSVKDSITIFYEQLFEKLEANYLYKNNVKWNHIKPYIKARALKEATWQESLVVTSQLFDSIQGDHLLLFSEKQMYQSNLKKEITGEQLHPSLIKVYTDNKGFEVKILEDNYGYVFIPGMLLLNATREELDARSQEIYDAVMAVNSAGKIKGWIIDLRYNIGGNTNVMLAGLYHLLGDNTVALSLNANKHLVTRTGLEAGVLYQNHEVVTQANISTAPNTDIPVALITGILTASAGEGVVLGFRGRENIVVIGEESAGLTTANDLFELPFGTKVAITLSYGTDRTAAYTPSIMPDVEIIKEANFENLSEDKNVMEAIRFIESRQ